MLQSTTKIDVPTFDLPISVQTVPEQVIQDQNALTISDALENVSGVRSNTSNLLGYTFNIRGFTSTDVFYNGLKLGAAIPLNYDTANVQSVDVLKGPASFLFGRAQPGGVVNVVTKYPLAAPYNSIEQQVGSFNLYRTVWDFTGPVQVPVLENGALSYRFSGSYQNGGQFVDFINQENVLLAPAVKWQITPDTSLTVEAEYIRTDAQSNIGVPAIGFYPASLPVYRSLGEPDLPRDTVRASLIYYEFKHRFDNNWAITNRFLAARDTTETADLIGDVFTQNGDPAPILNRAQFYQKLTGTNYSANLDLTGKFDVLGVKNDVLIGTDYFYSYYNYILSTNSGPFQINIYNPIYGTVPPFTTGSVAAGVWGGTNTFNQFSANQERDLGIYAQDLITLFDSLHILLGARYDLADVRSGASFSFGGSGDPPATFGQALADFNSNPLQHNQAFSPRVGVNYQIVPWLGFYGSYTKSFGSPGGINTTGTPFPPQIAEGWEGGVKAELLDKRLTATLAFFDITKSNILTSAPTPTDPFALAPIGLARSQGAELDILGKLTDEVSVIASYAHIDARTVVDNSGLLGKSLGVYAPNSGSVFLTYDFAPGSELHGWRFGGGVFAADNRWGDDANTFILPAYARLDLFARYQTTFGPTRVSAQINLNNVLDTRYYPGFDPAYAQFNPRFGIFPGAPRNVTASLRVEF